MSLLLVRHGRTGPNAAGLLLGRADPPLDEVGLRQAQALAAALAPRQPLAVVSSPLQRARATAAAVGEAAGEVAHEAAGGGSVEVAAQGQLAGPAPRPAPGLAVTVDERWIELDYGVYDGTPTAGVAAEVWERWRSDPAFVPPGGESLAALGERVRAACDDLADAASEGDVVVVSHVSPIKAAVAWALGVADDVAWRMHLDVGSITRIRMGRAGPVLVSFNEVAHLGG